MKQIDWLREDEVVDFICRQIDIKKSHVKECSDNKEKFKNVYKTDDKFESDRHEFWRSRELAMQDQVDTLKSILKEIYEVMEEDVKMYQEAEEDLYERRHEFWV